MHNDQINQTNDLIGRLLATENLKIFRSQKHKTAFFDIQNRHLYLPIWNVIDEVNQMLIAHEVSHALFSTREYIDVCKTEFKTDIARQCLNIIEDARIERLIKRRYPGLNKVFRSAYQYLVDNDFFGSKDTMSPEYMRDMVFLDRINLHFKLGFHYNIDFSAEELIFVNRITQAETLEQVFQISREVLKFLDIKTPPSLQDKEVSNNEIIIVNDKEAGKEQSDPKLDQQSGEKTAVGEKAPDDLDGGGDLKSPAVKQDNEAEETPSGSGVDKIEKNEISSRDQTNELDSNKPRSNDKTSGQGNASDNEQLELPTLDDVFQEKLQKTIDESYQDVVYWKLPTQQENINYHNTIVPYDTVFEEIKAFLQFKPSELKALNEGKNNEALRVFNTTVQKNVSYMVKEFNLRKAATDYKRKTTAKSGALDMKKLWGYKVKDDIFNSITITKDGQNHGMLFFLDWSGSMSDCLSDTIDQLIYLVSFCRKANIPHQVLAFSTLSEGKHTHGVFNKWKKKPAESIEGDVITIDPSTVPIMLLELFNSSMNNSKFNEMVKLLKTGIIRKAFGLASTPLNEALIFLCDYLGEFIKKHNVEKVSFISLTDGEGSCLQGHRLKKIRPNTINYLQHPLFPEGLQFDDNSSTQTEMLLKIIKKKYNCSTIGFFLNNFRLNGGALHYNSYVLSKAIKSLSNTHKLTEDAKQWMNSMLVKERYMHISNIGGRDQMFFLSTSNMGVRNSLSSIEGAQTVRQISKTLTKELKNVHTSRMLLNAFIQQIA